MRYDEIKSLSDKIKFYKAYTKHPTQNETVDSRANDSLWGAAYFCAAILFKSQEQKYHCMTMATTIEVAKSFNSDRKENINVRDLISKGWLRQVYNIITIPQAIRSAAHYSESVSKNIAELTFLVSICDEFNKTKFARDEFDDLVKSNDTGSVINPENVEGHYLKSNENEVSVNIGGVTRLVLENLSDFLFINYLKGLSWDEKQSNLQINIASANEIHSKHKSLFQKTPTIEEFIRLKFFKITDDGQHYEIQMYRSELSLRDIVHSKTAALLWGDLVESSDFISDDERLSFWYMRIVHHDQWVQIEDFFPAKLKKRFLTVIEKAVFAEQDISTGEVEYEKLLYDGPHARMHVLEPNPIIRRWQQDFPKQGDDLFELFEKLEGITNGHDELFFGQESRKPISYFISQLVLNDYSHKFGTVQKLLNVGASKPFIFWYTCFELWYWKPEVLPFLVESAAYSSLSFRLIYRIELNGALRDEKSRIKQTILEEYFRLLCLTVSGNNELKDEEKALLVFQCLSKDIHRKHHVSGGQDQHAVKCQHLQNRKDSDRLRKIFSDTKVQTVVFDPNGRFQPRFFPKILHHLVNYTFDYTPYDRYKNKSYSPPYFKMDLLSYFYELSEINNPEVEIPIRNDLQRNICIKFKQEFLKAFNIKSVDDLDYNSGELKPAIPSWFSRTLLEQTIDWGRMFLLLESQFLLDDTISPTEMSIYSDDGHRPQNMFTVEKLRTLVAILFNAYRNIYNRKRALIIDLLPVEQTLSKIENKITHYVTRYSKDDIVNGRIDIFSDDFERSYWANDKEELLPILGSLLNRFNKGNKQAIIKELLGSKQLIRSIKLLDYVISSQERKKMAAIIANYDDVNSFEEMSFRDLQFISSTLTQESEFAAIAEKAIANAETIANAHLVSKKRSGYDVEERLVFIYRMRLAQAYQTNDFDKIRAVPIPKLKSYLQQTFNAQDEQDFFIALVHLSNNEPEIAYGIFNRLISYSKDERSVLALNRFASKLQWADKVEDFDEKITLYRQAILEWDSFENASDRQDSWQHIKDKIWYNKLHAYEGLREDIEFDIIYNDLEQEIRLRHDFLEIRIRSLVRRKMQRQGEELLNEAKSFHIFDNGDYPDFIFELERLNNSQATTAFLQDQYGRIFKSSVDELIKIIPDSVNPHNKLPEFLLYELTSAADQMLTSINSISAIDGEDKYSDLLMLALRARLVNYQWTVSNQRGGFSDAVDTKKSEFENPGEIDFSIFAANSERLSVCEALMLEGKNSIEVQKHNLKIFNYDHARKLFFVVVYYLGSSFEDTWTKYISVVEDFISFPENFEMTSDGLEPVDRFTNNNSVKTAKSVHNTTELLHVFINVNYKLELDKKTVRDYKSKKALKPK